MHMNFLCTSGVLTYATFTAFLHIYTFLSFVQHDQVQLSHFLAFDLVSIKKLKNWKVFVQFPNALMTPSMYHTDIMVKQVQTTDDTAVVALGLALHSHTST